ncbi:pentatricopeptide repeat-containing protein, partial [Tanacetum coccineum]
LELNKNKHRFWHVIPAGGNIFEVRNGSEAFRVDEQQRTCTCRMWQLAGLPCPHSIVVIFKLNKKPEDYIPACFRNDAYYKAYHQYLTPVGGMTFWPDSIIPPKKQAAKRGRPKKNVGNVESRGNATIDMNEGVDPGTNVGSVGVESSAGNDTVRSASLGDFVSVRCEGIIIATTSRVRRGTSGSTSTAGGRGGHTLGVRIQQKPQAAEEGRHAQANRNIQRRNQNLRPRSARIMKNKLARSIDGNGSSNANAQDLD